MQKTIVERMRTLQSKGVSIKALAMLSDIPTEILYNVSRERKKRLSEEQQQKISDALNRAEKVFCND